MRNLKRALSLGLTAAMISGLMVMGSSAVSYPDSDQIQNQTAVEILGEIGVMVGDDNGNFNPTQDVTRAEMAVIITRILYGNDLNVDQFKGMNLFTDVPAWAEGFVNLCASLDIVAGVGDGKFAPNETVTAAQAALMLSRALGYFQNNAEFGNDWALAAIRRATSAGIIGDDMVLAANEGLSRDNVAQMTFNTLTKAVPVQYNELLNVYYNENQGITYALTFNYLQTLGYTNFDLVYDNGDTTIYGRPATTWGIGTYRTTTSDKDSGSRYDEALDADGGLISSNVQILSKDEIITIENEPDYVYTDGTAEEDIYDDLGAALCDEDEYDWSAYVNGEEVASADVVVPGRNVSTDYAYTGEGTQTEIYIDEGAKTVTVVEINYYLGQISSADEGEVIVRAVSDLGEAKLDDRTFATSEFAKGDYVVFTIDQNADDDFYVCEMSAPETVTGTVTRVNKNDTSDNTYLYLDDDRDNKYNYSDYMAYDLNDENVEQHPSLEKEYTLYLDPNGYVLAYSGDTTKSFLYVEDSDEELSDWEARVALADGTNDVVMVDSDLDHGNRAAVNFDDEDKVEWATENGDVAAFPDWVDSTELNNWDNIRGKVTDIDYQIWEYDTNDAGDLYTLTGRTTRYMENATITNGKAYIENRWNAEDVLIDNSTIFVDLNSNTAYTGYSNVPDVEDADIAYVLEDDNPRDVAEIVYIIDGEIYDADATVFVLTSDDRDTERYDGDNYYEFDDMYVDGRHTSDLFVAYDALADIHSAFGPINVDLNDNEKFEDSEIEAVMVGKVFKVLKSEDNYITEIELVNDWRPAYTVTSSGLDLMSWAWDEDGNLVTNVNRTKYTTDDETIYVLIEEEYNRTKTVLEGYDVRPGNYDDIIEFLDWDKERNDGYITVSQVVKADDGNADLVYIWKFAPEYHIREVTINVNREAYGTSYLPCWMWWSGVRVGDALNAFEQAMMDAGFNPVKNQYTYTIAGYEDEPEYKGDINSMDPDFAPIAVPYGHDDLVINITVENDDIACDAVDNLILDVTPVDVATPAISIDMANYGTIRYGFGITVPSDEEVTSVRWLETIVNENGDSNEDWKSATITADTALVTDNGNGTKTYRIWASAAGEFASGDVYVVRVSQAVINPDDQTDEGVYENGNDALIIAGGPADPTSLWNDARNYQFKLETPLAEYDIADELVKAMAVTEGEEPETVTKWYVDYTESVSLNGGEPYTTEQKREVAEDGVVSTVVDEKVPAFSAADKIVITITITKVYFEEVEVEPTPQTYTLTVDNNAADNNILVWVDNALRTDGASTPDGVVYAIPEDAEVVVAGVLKDDPAEGTAYVLADGITGTVNANGQLEFIMAGNVDLTGELEVGYTVSYNSDYITLTDKETEEPIVDGEVVAENTVVTVESVTDWYFVKTDDMGGQDKRGELWASIATAESTEDEGADEVTISTNTVIYAGTPVSVNKNIKLEYVNADGEDVPMGTPDKRTVYVAPETTLKVSHKDGNGVFQADSENQVYGVAVPETGVVVGTEAMTFKTGWIVNLGAGVTAEVNGEDYGAGTALVVVNGNAIDTLDVAEGEGTTIIEDNGSPVATEAFNKDTEINSSNQNITLVAAVEVSAPSNSVIQYRNNVTGEWTTVKKDEGTDVTTCYIRSDRQVAITLPKGTTKDEVKIEGVSDWSFDNGAVGFTTGVEDIEITVE